MAFSEFLQLNTAENVALLGGQLQQHCSVVVQQTLQLQNRSIVTGAVGLVHRTEPIPQFDHHTFRLIGLVQLHIVSGLVRGKVGSGHQNVGRIHRLHAAVLVLT